MWKQWKILVYKHDLNAAIEIWTISQLICKWIMSIIKNCEISEQIGNLNLKRISAALLIKNIQFVGSALFVLAGTACNNIVYKQLQLMLLNITLTFNLMHNP